ncbi:MAG: hypothetical protein IT366_07195 [Candidatus Hydrogenedentes bacterium]|nr:hypothetical protein [Candidatus Hydrogenedentota bacterium]
MNAKKIIRNLLLLFAIGSLAYMAIKEVNARRAIADPKFASAAQLTSATKLVVYFFSEGKECTTCEQIPLYTRAALEANFANELKSGEIVWCAIDVDEPRNSHYIDEYQIFAKTIVLSRVADRKQTRFKNLVRIWDYVSDKKAFVDFITKEIRAELDAAA